jgi:hypothetical protein
MLIMGGRIVQRNSPLCPKSWSKESVDKPALSACTPSIQPGRRCASETQVSPCDVIIGLSLGHLAPPPTQHRDRDPEKARATFEVWQASRHTPTTVPCPHLGHSRPNQRRGGRVVAQRPPAILRSHPLSTSIHSVCWTQLRQVVRSQQRPKISSMSLM